MMENIGKRMDICSFALLGEMHLKLQGVVNT